MSIIPVPSHTTTCQCHVYAECLSELTYINMLKKSFIELRSPHKPEFLTNTMCSTANKLMMLLPKSMQTKSISFAL